MKSQQFPITSGCPVLHNEVHGLWTRYASIEVQSEYPVNDYTGVNKVWLIMRVRKSHYNAKQEYVWFLITHIIAAMPGTQAVTSLANKQS